MTVQGLLALAGLVAAVLLLARFAPGAWRAWRIYAGTRNRRMADAGPLEVPAPVGVAARLEELRALGFSRIGERFIRLPGVPMRYDWVMGEPTGETYAVTVPSLVGGFLVALYSSFEDSTWVTTSFPRGETIETPTFHVAFVPTSLTDALATHRATVARLAARHGPARRVRTMADSLRMDADYRTHHGGRTLRRLTLRLISPALGAAFLVAICALLVLLER
jgi:hypothetical protein